MGFLPLPPAPRPFKKCFLTVSCQVTHLSLSLCFGLGIDIVLQLLGMRLCERRGTTEKYKVGSGSRWRGGSCHGPKKRAQLLLGVKSVKLFDAFADSTMVFIDFGVPIDVGNDSWEVNCGFVPFPPKTIIFEDLGGMRWWWWCEVVR